MCFKLSKKQIIILIAISLIGAILSYLRFNFRCIADNPCPPSLFQEYSYIYGFVIGGALTYLTEIIYNYFSDK